MLSPLAANHPSQTTPVQIMHVFVFCCSIQIAPVQFYLLATWYVLIN